MGIIILYFFLVATTTVAGFVCKSGWKLILLGIFAPFIGYAAVMFLYLKIVVLFRPELKQIFDVQMSEFVCDNFRVLAGLLIAGMICGSIYVLDKIYRNRLA